MMESDRPRLLGDDKSVKRSLRAERRGDSFLDLGSNRVTSRCLFRGDSMAIFGIIFDLPDRPCDSEEDSECFSEEISTRDMDVLIESSLCFPKKEDISLPFLAPFFGPDGDRSLFFFFLFSPFSSPFSPSSLSLLSSFCLALSFSLNGRSTIPSESTGGCM